jgi:3-oxoacyl-[acyl-carrier-protein] synthase III
MEQRVRIVGTGSYLPGVPVSADSVDRVLGVIDGLPARVATRAKRMERAMLARIGVKQRYYALDLVTRRQTETNASMAEKAICAALDAAGIGAETIDLLVVAGPMADYACPPTSALVQGRLKIESCTEMEIHSNCTGTPKAILIALDMLRSGRYRRAAVAYTQISSVFLRAEYFNPVKTRLENLALRWIMSDGSGALILERGDSGIELIDAYVESIGGRADPGMMGFLHGGLAHKVSVAGTNVLTAMQESGEHHLMQDIGEVWRTAPGHLVDGIARMLKRANIAGDDVAEFVLGIPGKHFVNEAILNYFRHVVGTEPANRYSWSAVDDFGYCGGATVLVQIDRLVRSGSLKPGDLVAVLCGRVEQMDVGWLHRPRMIPSA